MCLILPPPFCHTTSDVKLEGGKTLGLRLVLAHDNSQLVESIISWEEGGGGGEGCMCVCVCVCMKVKEVGGDKGGRRVYAGRNEIRTVAHYKHTFKVFFKYSSNDISYVTKYTMIITNRKTHQNFIHLHSH